MAYVSEETSRIKWVSFAKKADKFSPLLRCFRLPSSLRAIACAKSPGHCAIPTCTSLQSNHSHGTNHCFYMSARCTSECLNSGSNCWSGVLFHNWAIFDEGGGQSKHTGKLLRIDPAFSQSSRQHDCPSVQLHISRTAGHAAGPMKERVGGLVHSIFTSFPDLVEGFSTESLYYIRRPAKVLFRSTETIFSCAILFL